MSRGAALALLELALASACARPSSPGTAVSTGSLAPAAGSAASNPPAPLAPDATFSEARYTLMGARPVTPPGFTPVLLEGGFSGLNRIDDTTFWTISDRGPNGLVRIDGTERRTFFAPGFTPTIYRLRLTNGEARIEERIPLRLPPGKIDPARRIMDHGRGDLRRVTGLANGIGNVPVTEATSYDATGKHLLPADPYGVDTEGVAAAPDGTFWLAEEYRPSILHAARDGTLLERIVPVGTDTTRHDAVPLRAVLPAEYALRRENRGFEGVPYPPTECASGRPCRVRSASAAPRTATSSAIATIGWSSSTSRSQAGRVSPPSTSIVSSPTCATSCASATSSG